MTKNWGQNDCNKKREDYNWADGLGDTLLNPISSPPTTYRLSALLGDKNQLTVLGDVSIFDSLGESGCDTRRTGSGCQDGSDWIMSLRWGYHNKVQFKT